MATTVMSSTNVKPRCRRSRTFVILVHYSSPSAARESLITASSTSETDLA